MVRKERQRSSSPQLARFSNDSPQLKQASPPLYRTRQPRYTIPHICGHRQVVRHQLPKLTLAGSSPVARSSKKHKHGSVTLPCFLLPSAGTRTRQGASVKQTRSVCSEQARSPISDRSRCVFAKQIRRRPVARSTEHGRHGDGKSSKVFPVVSVNPRRLPTAGVRPRRGRADVPLPAPSAKGDAGTLGSIWSPSAVSWTGACRPQPARICEANTRTPSWPLYATKC